MAAAALDNRPQDRLDPPMNVEAEAALLGAMMIDNRTFDRVIDTVSTEDFYLPLHQRVFAAIQDQIALGRIASPVTLRPFFDDDPAMKELGGPGYLAKLTGSGAGLIGAKQFAGQIADLARLRRLSEGLQEALRAVHDTSAEINPAKRAAELEALVYEASATKTEARTGVFSVATAIRRVAAQVEDVQQNGTPIGAVAPDIPELEQVIGPLQRKHLIIWAGRPGMGKSALLCNSALSMARAGYGCGVISLEMGDIDLGQRFAADLCAHFGRDIPHAAIRDAKLTPEQLRDLYWASEQIDKLPLRLADPAGITLSRAATIARRMKRELEAQGDTLDVLFIDYLQLLNGDKRFENKTAEITAISQGCKELAKELDCAVVALSQLSRAVEQREIKIPQLSDLRESGSIEQDADTVLFLYRLSYYLAQQEPDRDAKQMEWDAWFVASKACQDHLDLICPKRRGGATGRTTVTFIREQQIIRAKDFYARNAGGMFNE